MKTNRTSFLIASLLMLVTVPVYGGESVWLTSLDLSKCRQGWGKPQVDRSISEKPLSIAGKTYEKGLGTHAVSKMLVSLKGGSQRFTALVGVDDGAKTGGDKAVPIVFRVVGDGRTLFKSGVMKVGDAAVPVDLDLRNVQLLVLEVQLAGDGIGWAHADWVDAKFDVVGEKPEAVAAPRGPAEILTPKPLPTPRINGTKVFGVRPGSPFLFTIPATGERPMEFSAEGLPDTLKLDPATGRITGTVEKRGEYVVTLRAKNALGTAERKFKIVVGDTLALTPHMGWNSWYCFDMRVTDRNMRDAADAMVRTDMINHGYMYVNIDEGWAYKPGAKDPEWQGEPRDAKGYVNSNKRFPDMKALTDYIHSKGLKAGIYTSPGPTACGGCTGSYGYEAKDAERFVEWGFDFLKYDWCSYTKVAKDMNSIAELRKPYEIMRDELKKAKRDMVFNLCQYGMGSVWEWGAAVGGNSWRTNRDIGMPGDMGASIFHIGFGQNGLEKWAGPGHWNDPDYLLLGILTSWKGGMAPTELTPDEQYAYVSLWSILASPLIMGGDVAQIDEFTLNLLCNDEVIEVDQDPLGRQGHRAAQAEDVEIWSRDLEDGSLAVGLFNTGDFVKDITVHWTDLGLQGKRIVRDLWRQKDLGEFDRAFKAKVNPRGVVFVRIYRK